MFKGLNYLKHAQRSKLSEIYKSMRKSLIDKIGESK